MARSKLDTLIYATILLAPMATAVTYIAMTPDPEILVQAPPEPCTAPTPVAESPVPEASPVSPVPEASPVPPVLEASPETEPSAPVERAASPFGAGMLIYEGQLVLTTSPDVTWSKGQLRSPPRDGSVIASKAVDTTRLPAGLADLVNARVVVYAADGSACTATTGAMTVYGRQDGDVVYPEDGAETVSAAQLLAARKQVFAEAQLLLARHGRVVDETRVRGCEGLWARRADLPAPAVFARHAQDADTDAALRQQVLAVIEDEPAVASLRDAYRTYRDEHLPYDPEFPAWPVFRDQTLFVTRWDEVGGARSFVNVELGDGGESCSDTFADQRAVLFTLTGGALESRTAAGFIGPMAIMDLERDGTLEAVTKGGNQLGVSDDSFLQSLQFPYHGCGC